MEAYEYHVYGEGDVRLHGPYYCNQPRPQAAGRAAGGSRFEDETIRYGGLLKFATMPTTALRTSIQFPSI